MTNQRANETKIGFNINTMEHMGSNNSGDSGIELVDLSLTASSIAVYRTHPPWLITTLTKTTR
jgi:hypothetical protein